MYRVMGLIAGQGLSLVSVSQPSSQRLPWWRWHSIQTSRTVMKASLPGPALGSATQTVTVQVSRGSQVEPHSDGIGTVTVP